MEAHVHPQDTARTITTFLFMPWMFQIYLRQPVFPPQAQQPWWALPSISVSARMFWAKLGLSQLFLVKSKPSRGPVPQRRL